VVDTEKDAVKRALENFEQIRKEKISGAKDIINDESEYKDEE